MADMKEKILLTALRLFAADGYEAVSVSAIAGELGLTKGALYRHYPGKRAVFEAILARMERRDAEQALESGLPEGTAEEMPERYRTASLGRRWSLPGPCSATGRRTRLRRGSAEC